MDWEKQETMRLLQGKPGTVYQEGNEAERAVLRQWLKSMLNVGVTDVTFIKADGSLRTMKATLDGSHIPQSTAPLTPVNEERKKPEKNDDVCKVWDTEAGAWRSFRYDRIKSITVNLG
jgi:hypothetical protein